jgi:hypothetical protein
MAHLNQLRIAARTIEGAKDRVDPVTRIAVDAVDTPRAQTGKQEISSVLGHPELLRVEAAKAKAARPYLRVCPHPALANLRRPALIQRGTLYVRCF